MLPRTLEPEAMDTAEEASEYDAMDHSAVNARFVGDFLAAHGAMRGGQALDVGTGTALIPIELCRQSPTARILAVDLADSMLDLASHNIATSGFSDRITLEKVDAKGLPYPAGSFEAVISNTIIHHIPDPRLALAEMGRLVAPGGTLFCRDLARPDTFEALASLVEKHASGESPHARALFEASLHAGLTLAEIQRIVRDLGLPPEGVTMTSDRHWTWLWRRPPGS